MPTQPVVELTSHGNFGLAAFVVFVLMMMAGTLIHGALRDRGFGAIGNGFFLFIGMVVGVFVMRGVQGLLA